jgi:hypothetical protein
MSLSRRSFLRSSTVTALFASLALNPLKTAFAQKSDLSLQSTSTAAGSPYYEIPQEAMRDRVFYFAKSTFEPHLNTDFVVRAGVIVTTLRLIEVEDCGSTDNEAAAGAGECFSLTFRADRTLSDLRTIHVFEHAALAEFNLFVAETKKFKDPDGIYYVAVINHQTRPAEPATRPLGRPVLRSGRP